jgi:hypothetical protein
MQSVAKNISYGEKQAEKWYASSINLEDKEAKSKSKLLLEL